MNDVGEMRSREEFYKDCVVDVCYVVQGIQVIVKGFPDFGSARVHLNFVMERGGCTFFEFHRRSLMAATTEIK